jgi:cytosine/adenosine deaminase-related metal-dependent hydrolase
VKLLLKNLRWWAGDSEGRGDLRVRRGVVSEVGRGLLAARGERQLDLGGLLALPGLINSHDHLHLDLLPHLGHPPYDNFYQWATEIYRPDDPPIRDVMRVALVDRLRWGGYRNLIAGVTTVVHHDPYERRWLGAGFPVRVLERYGWSHSLGYATDPARDFSRSRGPYLIHAAEGVDRTASTEIAQLDEMGLLGPRTVLVHGIAITAGQQRRLEEAGCAVVWCPSSNLHLYGHTARVRELKQRLAIALGTDSTISGAPHLLDELRVARETGLATPSELLHMVTAGAAAIFGFDDGRGRLGAGLPADLLLVPDAGGSPAEILLRTTVCDVALVAVRGQPGLANASLAQELDLGDPNVRIAGTPKWVEPGLVMLRRRILDLVGPAGLAASPLWSMIQPGGCR